TANNNATNRQFGLRPMVLRSLSFASCRCAGGRSRSGKQVQMLGDEAKHCFHFIERVVGMKRKAQSVVAAGTDNAILREDSDQIVSIGSLQNDQRSYALGRRLCADAEFRHALDERLRQAAHFGSYVSEA